MENFCVQKLAGALGTPDVPTRYVVRGNQDQQLATTVVAPVPVINLGLLSKQDGGAADEAAKLRSAIDSWGLFLVSNDPIGCSRFSVALQHFRE